MKVLIRLSLVGWLLLVQNVWSQTPPGNNNPNMFPLYLKVQLEKFAKLSSLKSGGIIEGDLARDVYSLDRKVFAAGAHVRLTVDHLERQRKAANDHWPWVVRVFTPRYGKFPSFKEAAISMGDGSKSLLEVSLISASRRTEVHAQSGKKHNKDEGGEMSAASSAISSGSPKPPPGTILSFAGGQRRSDALVKRP